jgi:hypothetical protein
MRAGELWVNPIFMIMNGEFAERADITDLTEF